ASWHQVPAASLPDDDRVLAQLAGYGRVIREWQKVRDGALRGWVKCSDGRLYHPVVAEKALAAWASRQKHAFDKCCERQRKENQKRKERGEPALGIPTFEQWKSGVGHDGIPPEGSGASAGIPPGSAGVSAGIPPESPRASAGKVTTSAGIPPE